MKLASSGNHASTYSCARQSLSMHDHLGRLTCRGSLVQVQYRPPIAIIETGASFGAPVSSRLGRRLTCVGSARWGRVAVEPCVHGHAVELDDAERRILADREETGHVEGMLLQG